MGKITGIQYLYERWSSFSATQKIVWINIIVSLLYSAGINLLILQSEAGSVDAPAEYVDDSPGIEFLYTGPMLRLTFLYVIGAGLHSSAT